ncbi:MAG: tetratricopeptide repeat protein [Bdellovibrionaceae bacterium]|nr:tetratricopeptide repeat protein [Pseudobdellovibrionaceae bacterium]
MNAMQEIQPELIEKYQLLLQKDPKSQVFAPLTEAYRKMGLVEEAFRIAVRGVQFNPHFGGGRIALAKVFLDRDNAPGALAELEKAVELSPDNILAHSLLGDCYLKTQRPKDALRSFKMVLFLAPNNEKAMKAVRKLESLTADEYEDDLFEMKPLPQVEHLRTEAPVPLKPVGERPTGDLERILSLVDAFIVRNDMEKALSTLKESERSFGQHPELIKRLKLVNQRSFATDDLSDHKVPSRQKTAVDSKIEFLRELLGRVQRNS